MGTNVPQAVQERGIRPVQRPRIMIVEDEILIVLSLRADLARWHYDVCAVASSEREAIACAAVHKPQAIIMDVSLGRGGDGIAAARAISEQTNVPIIYVTAQSDPLTVSRMHSTGPAAIIFKPYNPADLQNALRRAISLPDNNQPSEQPDHQA